MIKKNYTDFGVSCSLIKKPKIGDKKQIAMEKQFEEFKKLKESKKRYILSFSRVTKDGTLSTVINGINIILPSDKLKIINRDSLKLPSVRSNLLTRRFEVTIENIDIENKTVNVAHYRYSNLDRDKIKKKINALLAERKSIITSTGENLEEKIREQILDELKKTPTTISKASKLHLVNSKLHEELEEKKTELGASEIIVPARIADVRRNELILDIMNYGIPGVLPSRYWQYSKIDDFNTVCKVGDIVDVAVVAYGKAFSKKKGITMYVCSRIPLLENPWINFPYKEGDIVKVKCTAVKEHNFFGVIAGLDIQIYCEYTNNNSQHVEIGEEYDCTLYRIKPDTRLVKARLYKHIVDKRH